MTSIGPQTDSSSITDTTLEAFGLPAGARVPSDERDPIAISSVIGVISRLFKFKDNTITPGRELEQAIPINRPADAGFFVALQDYRSAFTSPDFQKLTERPLGEFSVDIGLSGNNFICRVRLTDRDSNDPVSIDVRAVVVFFQ